VGKVNDKRFFVYILASDRNGTLYVGVTGDLIARIYQHRSKANRDSFSARYGVTRLVHFEIFDDPENAIRREKRLKKWDREWKINLIERDNPHWDDLYDGLL